MSIIAMLRRKLPFYAKKIIEKLDSVVLFHYNPLTNIFVLLAINESAGVAQLVEYKLPKLGVAGSNPVTRFYRK